MNGMHDVSHNTSGLKQLQLKIPLSRYIPHIQLAMRNYETEIAGQFTVYETQLKQYMATFTELIIPFLRNSVTSEAFMCSLQ